MVEEFAPVLSKECIDALLKIIKSKATDDRGEWQTMKQILGNALLSRR